MQLLVLLMFCTRVNDFGVKWLLGDAIGKASKPRDITIILAKTPQPSESTCNYLNLLTMTAMIKSTSTVMIAIVTILFVAILVLRQYEFSTLKSP